MSQTIKDLYFGDEEISKDTIKQFVKLSGDHSVLGGTEVVVRELVKWGCYGKSPTYRYMYSNQGSINVPDLHLLHPWVLLGKIVIQYMTGWKIVDYDLGTCHGDDHFVMFQPHM